MAVMCFRHLSQSLTMLMECNIVLPDEYVERMQTEDNVSHRDKLKVLWLCHGGSGDHNEWLYKSRLTEIVNRFNMAAIIVNANDSCFVDMAYGLKYGTYLGEELPVLVHRTFDFLSDRREDNYIAGLSNGGYGCLYLGLKYPKNFYAIGAFSAGDKADAKPKPFLAGQMNPRIRMFGSEEFQDTEYSIKYLAKQLSQKDCAKPKIYHACGGKDPWLDMNLLVKECFESIDCKEYEYQYHQIDDLGHEWKFWEKELNNFLMNIMY